jgi:hypothetical protein
MANTPNRMPHSQPSQAELEARMADVSRNDPRNRVYGFDEAAAGEAYQLTRRSHVTPTGVPRAGMAPNPHIVDESFAAALPIASGRGEFARTQAFQSTLRRYGPDSLVTQAYAVLGDEQEAASMGYDVTAGTYYNPQTYNNLAADARDNAYGPAPITIRPTQTTNPKRPRTVAAGYDPERKTLTVIFRDGTFYNYYNVGAAAWDGFKAAPSKGKYIRRFLDQKPRGEAEMSYLSKQAQELFYRVSRTNQILYDGNQNLRPKRQPAPRVSATKGKGYNPSTGGRNPANQGRRKP